MKHIITTIAAIIALSCINTAKAQLSYKEREYITIGTDTPNPNYGITADGYGFMRLMGTGGFLLVSTGHTYCYIMGSNMAVCFYDAYLNKYNNIRSLYVLYRANGEIYDDWVEPQSSPASIIGALRPVTYRLKPSPNEPVSRSGGEEERQVGFISQEVEKVLPKAVVTDPHGNQLVNYSALTPVAACAIGQLYERARQNRERLQQINELLSE